MTEQLHHTCAEASVPMSDAEYLQSIRDTRDQARVLASELRAEQIEMAALNERSGVELRESQERFAEDFRRFQAGASANDAGDTQHRASAPNEESVPSRPHVVAEHEPLDMHDSIVGTEQMVNCDKPMWERPLCAICGERTNRRVWQDLDPHSPTYQEYSTTCSNTCRSLEHRAIQEADMMSRVRILMERREAEEMSTVSGESSAGSQNQSSGSHHPSRSSRRWRSNSRRSHHRAGKASSSSVQHEDDCRGKRWF